MSMRDINLVFLGEKQTGKTTLLNRFLHEPANDKVYKVEVDTTHKTLLVPEVGIKIHLINSSGKERKRVTISEYIHDSSVFIVVYDITNPSSFASTMKWVDIVRSEHGQDAIIMLVGNKTELESKRQVSTKDGEEMGKNLNVMFIETSGIAGPNVQILFRGVVDSIQRLGVRIPEKFAHHHHALDGVSGCSLA